MNIAQFQSKLETVKADSAMLIARMKEAESTFDILYPLMKQYLYLKFMLLEEDISSDDILILATASVEQIAGLRQGGLKFKDRSGTCASVSSAVTKKILLLLSLQRALEITFDTADIPDIVTISELTDLTIRQIHAKEQSKTFF